jgi:DNA polymerase III delta prime subunit
MRDDFIYVEKYAPKSIDDCILPQYLTQIFSDYRDTGKVPNMTLAGPPGVGKTSTIKALAHELKRDFMAINGSDERSIDVVRNKIRNYASTVSMMRTGKKILLIDEADNLTYDAQLALRGSIQDLQNNCSFILTCNYPNRIDPSISESRCPVIEFSVPSNEKPALALRYYKRILEIVKAENVVCEDNKVLMMLVEKYFPDFRRTLFELQKHATSGTIRSNILAQTSDIKISSLFEFMKQMNFTEVRKWTINNLDNDSMVILRRVFDNLDTYVKKASIPDIIIIIRDHQDKNVMDKEVNLLACFAKIMCSAEWL